MKEGESKKLAEFAVKYAEAHQLLFDLIPLVSYICEDPYLGSCNESKELLHDYIAMAKLVEMELIQRIKLSRAFENVPSTYSENSVYLDRVMAAEFKLKNRHENASECLTIFSQVFYNYRGKLWKMKNRGD